MSVDIRPTHGEPECGHPDDSAYAVSEDGEYARLCTHCASAVKNGHSSISGCVDGD